jgi:hypothetical protein
MPKLILQTRFAMALESRGLKRVNKTNKYLTYQHPDVPDSKFWYLGNSGSVRIGKNRTTCLPARQDTKDKMLAVTAHLV